MGTSAQPYFPSIQPLTGAAEHIQAGASTATTIRVTNWGSNADVISLSAAAATTAGAGASGITVSFSPAGPLSLASGAFQDVVATISVGAGVPDGAYDVSLTATSAGTGNRKDVRVVAFNVQPDASLPNTGRVDASRSVVSVTGPQVSPSFWACPSAPGTLWAAYLDGYSHSGSPAKVFAARSTDGGVSWQKWQVDAGDGYHYFPPAIAGRADCSSVTVAWVRETTTDAAPTYSQWLYSRTWTESGGWATQGLRDSLIGGASYFLGDQALIYDNQGDILLTWWRYTGTTTTTGVYSAYSTNNGGAWTAAASVIVGANHRYPALTLDTVNNHVWMAVSYAGTTRDIYVKYWNGATNAWNAANTVVANTGDRENHPAIAYVNGRLWVAWNRYADYSAATPVLYFTYSTSTLPAVAWAAVQGPYGTRLAEHTAPTIAGDNAAVYTAYLAYSDAVRGGNIYALKVNAATGAYERTYQLTCTVDDPPLNARGNAGSPVLQWATTRLNNDTQSVTGPTLLYTKNAPSGDGLAAGAQHAPGLGAAQTLYNEEEDFDLWLTQVGTFPTAVSLVRFEAAVDDGQIIIEWQTASEVNTLGFNVYRAIQPAGRRTLLNAELIPSRVAPGSPFGAAYAFVDTPPKLPMVYYYWVEEVSTDGAAMQFGPITARPVAAHGLYADR